ncbi:MAG: stage II sporulation protein M [Methanobrevibacter sp.]|uniref:stage II sporulation protein M n=1 Tax=Methanobrevibacter sp. TaxID=66852 RepID=UPI0026DFE6E4|nr:stage II sporulation protein M [Methanobrevibacter sp.]MDO5849137.1 stage II sporulation protein M [Methanobrevibacter sp.]
MNIKHDVREAFADNRYIILISALIFLITLFAGYFFHSLLSSYLSPAVQQLSEGVKNGSIQITFQTIFLNNLLIILRLFVFGIIFCFSCVVLAYNGLFLGYFIANAGNLVPTILLIVPHGIFELPSIVIANASGLILLKYLIRVFTLKNCQSEKEEFVVNDSIINKLCNSLINNSKYLKHSLILLAISIVLMAIAGVIEVYVTRNLAFFLINFFGLK